MPFGNPESFPTTSDLMAKRQDTSQDVLSQIWVQWTAIASFLHMFHNIMLYCCFATLNQIMSCQNSFCISGLGISRHTGFSLEFPSPKWIAGQGQELHPPGGQSSFVDLSLCDDSVLQLKLISEHSDEPRCEKTGFLHMRKQRRRSASR